MAVFRRLALAAMAPFFVATALAAADDDGLIETMESVYNTVLVHRRGDLVSMSFGYNRRLYTESVYNTKDERDLPVAYTRYMTASLAYVTEARNILEIGFGGGRTAWYLHRHLPAARISSVELDPAVVELARRYFGIRDEANFFVAEQDGRRFLMTSAESYDVILIDAYRGPFVPFHLLTREFYALAKDKLAPGGVLAQNIEPSTMLFDAAVATLMSVFDNVEFFVAGGNVVTIAYDGPPRAAAALLANAQALQARHGFRYPLPELIASRKLLGEVPENEPLTDDFAPVETLKAIDKHNTKWTDAEAAQ